MWFWVFVVGVLVALVVVLLVAGRAQGQFPAPVHVEEDPPEGGRNLHGEGG